MNKYEKLNVRTQNGVAATGKVPPRRKTKPASVRRSSKAADTNGHNVIGPLAVMNGKPVYELNAKTIINLKSDFVHKQLCDGLAFSTCSTCPYNCRYCSTPCVMAKTPHLREFRAQHPDVDPGTVVLRRANSLGIVRRQLTNEDGTLKYTDPKDTRVIFGSPIVDIAPNPILLNENVDLCKAILDWTPWHIRLLSKSNALPVFAQSLGEVGRKRVVYGVSTGTLDDKLARAIECGTPLVSKRIASLHWLQDNGFRTFGMPCPSLPQRDYVKFAKEMAAAIRPDRCEGIWAEVLNPRGKSMPLTISALRKAGYSWEADALERVATDKAAREAYARETFEAHAAVCPPGKFHFLQYASKNTRAWWEARQPQGAIVL
jgi:DNA repair photolyase